MGINIGSYTSSSAQLSDASDNLEMAWMKVKEDWNDGNSLHFEENHLLPILQEVKMSLQAIQNFTSVLSQADRACSPEREPGQY